MMQPSKTLAWSAFGSVVALAAFLGVREGIHRGKQSQDAQRLREARQEVQALRDTLQSVRSRVDTIADTVTVVVERVERVVVQLDSAILTRQRELAQAGRMRQRADSLLLRVPPAEILDRTPATQAAYAYRAEADTLRAQNQRLDATLQSTRSQLGQVTTSMLEAQARLRDVSASLGGRDAEIASLRRDLRKLQTAREDRCLLGLIVCPSRTVVAIAGGVLGAAATVAIARP